MVKLSKRELHPANLPKTVTITGAKFTVTLDPLDRKSREAEEGDWGESHSLTQTIKISSFLEPEERSRVLWHEFVHMVLARAGLDEMLGPKLEESVVLALEHAWDDVQQLVKKCAVKG
jgi:hypothetical protein